jgi:two-component system phosphate regulon sensor histidine kinase PhoR
MKRRSIVLIIGLMGLALLGVMAMQFYFLRQSYLMQSELFDSSVKEAMNTVVAKVAKQDAMNFLNGKSVTFSAPQAAAGANTATLKKVSFMRFEPNVKKGKSKLTKQPTARELKLTRMRDSLNRVLSRTRLDDELLGLAQEGGLNLRFQYEEFTDENGVVHQRFGQPEIISNQQVVPVSNKVSRKLHKYDTLQYLYIDPQFGKQVIFYKKVNPLWLRDQERKKKERELLRIKKMLEADSMQRIKPANNTNPNVIENLALEYKKAGEPLKKRVDPRWIDSLLRFELHNQGITLPFSYAVMTANSDSLIFSKAMDSKGEAPVFLAENTYQMPIFGKEILSDPGKMLLSFPQKNSLILNRMGATMATTGGLLLVLIFCFGYTIFSILRQKKISEMKTDFINNMTHEFKTPVSTIMIASESLRDAEIAEDKNRVSKLANIIYEENARLGSHIERVLNIARIEKNDFKLDLKPVDVNDMITAVVDSMALKLQRSNAVIALNLEAIYATIKADELHFSNVLYNLLDNAIKYSTEAPDITISTINKGGQVIIKVADKGIGMSRDQQVKIFEQFYRIPTGNLHDVKGFGLGLSYVNTIVKRLNGTISVKSEKDKGSEFELKFDIA